MQDEITSVIATMMTNKIVNDFLDIYPSRLIQMNSLEIAIYFSLGYQFVSGPPIELGIIQKILCYYLCTDITKKLPLGIHLE